MRIPTPKTNATMTQSKHSKSSGLLWAKHLLEIEGRTTKQAIKILRKEGHSEKSAKQLVIDASRQKGVSNGRGGARDIVFGALWCIGGLIATLFNDYLIFSGAILFGAFQLIRGLVVRYAPR